MSNFYKFLLFFIITNVFSQNEVIVTGTVLDINTQLPLESATIFFSKIKDSTLVEFAATDKNGFFKIVTKKTDIPVMMKVNRTGYQTYLDEKTDLITSRDYGKLHLLGNTYVLNEVVIENDIPIKIKKDTLEYNASSFKVRPDATVETLLKELPGFEVDNEGKITVNGKEVNQVLVNGKPFFDKEGAMVLKNLPAEIINKVQVSDFKTKKQELAKQNSTSDFSSINITIDEKKNKGKFGRFLAGYGTDDRYESSFILNFFKKKQKISILGSANNINSSGFSMDDVFDNMSGGRNSKNVKTVSSIKGITESKIGGISYADEWNKKIETVGSYDFTNTINRNEGIVNQVNFLPQGSNFTKSQSKSTNENTQNKATFEIEYKISPSIRLSISPKINKSNSQNDLSFSSASKNDIEEPINENNTTSSTKTNDLILENTMNLNKSFQRKFRNLSFVFTNNYNSTYTEELTFSKTVFFKDNRKGIEREQNILSNNSIKSNAMDFEFTEPINDSLRVRVGVDFDWSNNVSDLSTFEIDEKLKTFTDLNEKQSNYIFSSQKSIRPKMGLTFEKKNYTFILNANTSLVHYDNYSLYINNRIDLNKEYLLPEVNGQIRYTINKSKLLTFKYEYNYSLPTPEQLLPVSNLSNPLVTFTGNPSLNPTSTQKGSIVFNNYNFRQRLGYVIFLKTIWFDNEIVTISEFDDDGKKTNSYTNINGTHTTSIGGNLNQKQKNGVHVFRYGINFNGRFSFDKGITNMVLYKAQSVLLTPSVYLSYDYGELLTLAPSYRFSYNETKYENLRIESNSNVVHTINLQTTTYWPKKWVWGNDFGFTYNSNISDDFKKYFYLWNTSLSYSFFEDKMAFKVKIFDLFNKNQSTIRSISPTRIRDEENTVLKRYTMFSLSYKLGEFNGKKKSPQKESKKFKK